MLLKFKKSRKKNSMEIMVYLNRQSELLIALVVLNKKYHINIL